MKKAGTATFIVLLALLLAPMPGARAQGFNVSVFPAKTELTMAPGTSMPFYLNVHNFADNDITLKISFKDYLIRANNEFVFQDPGHYSYSCANWLSTDTGRNPDSMVVPARAVVRKGFQATVPAGAEPGGHYGAIILEHSPPGGSPVVARPRIAPLVLITVPGEIVRKGVIQSVSVQSAWFFPTKDVAFIPEKRLHYRVVFRNEGNVHLTLKGRLIYTPTFGMGSGIVMLPEGYTVLPKTTRYIEGDLPDPPFFGSYKAKAEVQYGPSLDVFDTTKTGTTSFSVYPLSLILLAVLVVVVVAAAVLLSRWLYRRKGSALFAEMHGGRVLTDLDAKDFSARADTLFLTSGWEKVEEPGWDAVYGRRIHGEIWLTVLLTLVTVVGGAIYYFASKRKESLRFRLSEGEEGETLVEAGLADIQKHSSIKTAGRFLEGIMTGPAPEVCETQWEPESCETQWEPEEEVREQGEEEVETEEGDEEKTPVEDASKRSALKGILRRFRPQKDDIAGDDGEGGS